MAHRKDRMWLLGGIVAMLLLVAGSWFLLISPKNAEADDVHSSADDASAQLVILKHQVAALKAESAKLASYKTQLKTNQMALPTTSGVPDFLRQLQDSGVAVDVDISNISVGAPEPSKAVPSVYELPISLSAVGTVADMSSFLKRLQEVQPRAVLLNSVGLTESNPDTADPTQTASISLLAFVSPPAGSGKPTTN
jgi:Tfp pilus assembly protein PilO